jgi:multiple antibiotic resistance protein
MEFIQLVILFFVIFDPFLSFSVFVVATKYMPNSERRKTAIYAILIAASLSALILLFGQSLLVIFNASMENFKIAAGIILGLLGIKMARGQSISDWDKVKGNSSKALAALIGTPLLTGPAVITTIIVTVHDYGILLPGLAVGIVLLMSAVLLLQAIRINKITGHTFIKVLSTILGLITIAWGVNYIRVGLGI